MTSKQINIKEAGYFNRRTVALFTFCCLTLGFGFCSVPEASAQDFYLNDYHFRAGDGGKAALTFDENVPKAWGTPMGPFFMSNWFPNIIGPDNISITIPGSAADPTFSGSDTLGKDGGTATTNGQISLNAGQASASGGRGGDVVINFKDGHVLSNSRDNASRYIFTAGDGTAGGSGGNVSVNAKEVTVGTYSALIFSSGADGGGNKGGEVNFIVDKLNLGSGSGSSVFFEKKANGGEVKSSIKDLWVYRDSALSYSGTSAMYNTIDNINLRTAAKLTLYGKAGNRYDPEVPHEFDKTGNYTADRANITVLNGNSSAYLNIQGGAIKASSIEFMNLSKNFIWNDAKPQNNRYILVLNSDNASSNPSRPDILAGESSLGVLDLRGLDKNNIKFTFNPESLLSSEIGKTFCLVQGNMTDGTYLLADSYGTFGRNFGAQMYLFDLDGSSGDMLLTYLGLDGGFTHYIKSYFQGHAAAATTVNAGGQFLSDSVIANARMNSRLNQTTSSLSIGGSKMKTETGSDIDSDNYNAALSGSYLFELGRGTMLFGAFVEAGKSNYDTFHNYVPEAPQRNDGKADFYGGGAFARYEFPLSRWDGFYAEGSVRGGKVDNKFNGIFGAENVSYENHSTYYGAHLGLGKVFSLREGTELDLYAKGFYNVVDGGGVDTTAKENLDFDKVESFTTRLGTRVTHEFNECVRAYVGGAWEKEFNGRVDGTYLGKDYKFGTELSGNSGFGEIGLNVQPLEIPLTVELSAFGKGGRQEGFGGSLAVKYTYF